MKKIFMIISMLCMMIISFTSCGKADFDGKWECEEAEVDTYGGTLSNSYDAIENAGMVSTLCEMKIKGEDVEYSESLRELKVSNVKINNDVMTFEVKNSIGISTDVTVRSINKGKNLEVTHGSNTYILQKASIFNGIPVWAIVILVIAAAVVLYGKIAAKKNTNNNQPPSFH